MQNHLIYVHGIWKYAVFLRFTAIGRQYAWGDLAHEHQPVIREQSGPDDMIINERENESEYVGNTYDKGIKRVIILFFIITNLV